MTLQPYVVYNAVDGLLGGDNVAYFSFHATAIVTIGLLDGIVQEAVSVGGLTRRRNQVTALVTGAIVTAQAVLFFGGDWRFRDQIHEAFPNRWDFAAYSSTTWIAMALFSVSVGAACASDLRLQHRLITRASLALVVLGCLGVLVYTIVSFASVTAALLSPDFSFDGWPYTAYHIALATAPVCLGLGLGLTAMEVGIQALAKTSRNRVLLWQITPLWERLLAGSPELSIERDLSRVGLLLVRAPGAHLYRRYVEVRDSLLLNPDQSLTVSERTLINAAENHVRAIPAAASIVTTLARPATPRQDHTS
ncbi:hypothetical protein E3T34_05805 [Cryobacterium sp. TMT1-62]|uniref:DUF6545 domain-containing protein n=1 Tax=Cryobacterium sandaracinum TaxID=1259247 RepID=A0ABY2JN40_9MICO|nr:MULTISPECIES: DUF6545 domain-containing protein [Cryobacterium]TFB57956.1 hypothetical protein E3N86_15535 [Cryobacterium sp. Hz7]TFD07281.1 hypothetical protein E3T25_00765 [Cryobacterium sandaracinum]TFD33976.1 hypothetical protein E3T34_05805 [Cryobacterium sp. TMT1-62]